MRCELSRKLENLGFELINAIHPNAYISKKVKFGKGKNPWSKDSVIRGPIISKYGYSFLKTKYSLMKGIKKFIEFAKIF